MNRCLAAGNLREQSAQSEKQAYAASRCKNKGEVVAIFCSKGWAMQFPCFYEKSKLEIPMAHNVS
ncbi:hypothetical protein HKD37_07G017735 [Glycine soja]